MISMKMYPRVSADLNKFRNCGTGRAIRNDRDARVFPEGGGAVRGEEERKSTRVTT